MNETILPAVGIDCDDVLKKMHPVLTPFMNRRGYNYSYEDIHEYDLCKFWDCSYEEVVEHINDFYASEEFANLEPEDGAQKAVSEIGEVARLYVITSRPFEIEDITKRGIDRYFPDVFTGIIHVNSYQGNGARRKKSDVCKELGIRMMVDDHIDHAIDCRSAGLDVVLLRKPWNRKYSDDMLKNEGIELAENWGEAAPLVRKLLARI